MDKKSAWRGITPRQAFFCHGTASAAGFGLIAVLAEFIADQCTVAGADLGVGGVGSTPTQGKGGQRRQRR
jgi:hypothetical protein